MKVMMLGWEFPPFIAGGLGTACYGLTRGLNSLGVDVMFVLPRPVEEGARAAAVQEKMLGGAGPHMEAGHAAAEAVTETTAQGPVEDVVVQAKEPLRWVETVTEAVAVRHLERVEEEVVETVPVKAAAPTSSTGTSGAPRIEGAGETYRLEEFEHVTFRTVDVMLSPYMGAAEHQRLVEERTKGTRAVKVEGKIGEPTHGAGAVVEPAGAADRVVRRWHDRWVTRWENRTFEVVRTDEPSQVPPQNGRHHDESSVVGAVGSSYCRDLVAETQRYADLAVSIAEGETFDVIHAHDWMTYKAGVAVARKLGRPLVVHVHSTEFDRSGEAADPRIVEIEREGLKQAAKVIAVSLLTKRGIIARYDVSPDKIEVVHNAIDVDDRVRERNELIINKDEKIVLFLGRVTYQKGPEFFLAAARKVLNYYDSVKFIIAGSGDLIRPTIELAAAMGIGHKVLFTGFLRSKDVEKIYRMADLYVMPSVSEPFGIAPLEAMAHDVPVIVSKESGVSEVIKHALKVDFGDVDELADKILAVLRHPELAGALRKHGRMEVHQMSWRDAAEKVVDVYGGVMEEA